ncbi:hypothetical protein M569_04287 [Genlisea aurea]|uniref:Cyclic nucleotide-binding domain-containing protein n=1 Tax=Genlisea aurea TaxID=192259 RepID=S8E433_9LAMI|nr:hypothetical protein M569_04287 [Genlisea aurea]
MAPETKDLSSMLQKSLEGAIILKSFPKTTVDVFALVLESGGSDLSVITTCASLALADAGILLYDLSCHGKILVVDPVSEEESCQDGSLMITCMPSRYEVTQMALTGEWTTSKINEVTVKEGGMQLCLDACSKLGEIMSSRKSIDDEAASENSSPAGFMRMVAKIRKNRGTILMGEFKVLSRVFSEDYEVGEGRVFDPRGRGIRIWNRIFLSACLASLFVDPLFFYLPAVVSEVACIDIEFNAGVVLTVVRSVADIFYALRIYMQFRTAYVAPSSRVFGRGELVVDPSKIASRYLRRLFWLDVAAALPLPQALIWFVIPIIGGSVMMNAKNVLRFVVIFQYFPRLLRIFPLVSQIVETAGVITERAWAGAAYNLMLYMLASHVLGAAWYLLSIERQESCWRHVCNAVESPDCRDGYFDCRRVGDAARKTWFRSSNITRMCDPDAFGIYADAVSSGVVSAEFFDKYLFCLRWGLKTLSCLGQNLAPSTGVGEILFAVAVVPLGLVLFALLIGNMQTYLQSTTMRLEEWRIRRTDTERWMRHRRLPAELREAVRRYDRYRWIATRGVDEEALLGGLPRDLRRDIKRHLCCDLVRRVPLLDEIDGRILDAICERLKPALCTEGTCLMREGDPVEEMLFIIRGDLDSFTTGGGRTGFFNSCRIGSGEFCGEEILPWALDPRPSRILPSSTRTVRSVSEVEAFALRADDLRFVAARFRRFRSKRLRWKFRFHSHQWRAWAACFIQAAWRRCKRRRMAAQLRAAELLAAMSNRSSELDALKSGDAGSAIAAANSLVKPSEPDFSALDED